MQKRVVFALLLNCAVVLRAGAQQQIVDPDFKPVVEKPAYRRNGPVVAIDEAHANFHTASGQYKPFADLLANDGYTVKASKLKFEKGAFAGIDVLVIANALSATRHARIPACRLSPNRNATRCATGSGKAARSCSSRIMRRSEALRRTWANVSASRWEKAGLSIGLRQAARPHSLFSRARTGCSAPTRFCADGMLPRK